jgi:hypothetical protein
MLNFRHTEPVLMKRVVAWRGGEHPQISTPPRHTAQLRRASRSSPHSNRHRLNVCIRSVQPELHDSQASAAQNAIKLGSDSGADLKKCHSNCL